MGNPYLAGTANILLLASIGVGSCLCGDIGIRMSQQMEVSWPSFLGAGLCLSYLLLYILVKLVFKKGDVIWQTLSVFSAVGASACLFVWVDSLQAIGAHNLEIDGVMTKVTTDGD